MTGAGPSRLAARVPGPHESGEPLRLEVDLASRWTGSSVMAASDESFGDKENLLKPGPAVFDPGHYGNRGEIVDGWETKRRREPGNDWALVRLGTPGIVTSIDVDSSYFTGNYPEFCLVEACGVAGYPSPAELLDASTEWLEIVPRSRLRGDAHNTFPVSSPHRFTHVRLSTFPDGGLARLRVNGRIVPDPRQFDGVTIDLANQEHGGAVVATSDGFYTSASMLNRPDWARTMGEGWETRRRRDDGHDHVIVRLAAAGRIRQLIVDTAHYKYNASAAVEVYAAAGDLAPSVDSSAWRTLLPRTRLQPDTRHVFAVEPDEPGEPVEWVRLDAFPDGGLSRLRVLGDVAPAARAEAAFRWFNSLPARQARAELESIGLVGPDAEAVIEARPVDADRLGDVAGGLAADPLARLHALLIGPSAAERGARS